MNEPELRFKADDGSEFPEWEEDELGNYCNSISSGKVKALETDGQYILYGSTGQIGRTNIPEFTGTHVTIARVGANAGTVNLRSGIYGISDNTLVIDHKDNLIPEYLANRLISYDLGRLIFGSGQPLITGRQLKTLILKFPCIKEQQKIADLFSTLDNVINSVHKEVDSWKQMKRGVMQKLFGQEVRFKADDGTEFPKWKNKQIEDIGYCIAGATPNTRNDEYWLGGTIPWMSSGEVNNGIIFDTEKKITKLGYDKTSTKLVPPGTVVIALAGQGKTRGKVAITRIELCTNQSLASIVAKTDYNADYLYQYLLTCYDDLRNISSGDRTRGGLNLKLIEEYKIMLPCLEEQQKIAECLSEFDLVIEKTRQKLEAYKQLKKGLMQRMFA